jgi:hypothetical protein
MSAGAQRHRKILGDDRLNSERFREQGTCEAQARERVSDRTHSGM